MTTEHFMEALVLLKTDAPFARTTLPRPEVGPGQVLVRVRASGVNPLDIEIRRGEAPHAKHPPPSVLGLDLAGVVEGVGPGASSFKIGDEVFGLTGGVGGVQGSLAGYAAVDADLLAVKPASVGMREAAAIPLVFITAWEGLVDRAHLHPRQKVLVHGVGAIGNMVIQVARALGADVFAVDIADRGSLIESLGATAINRDRSAVQDYVAEYTDGRGFDVVYDTLGGAALDDALKSVRRFGHVVSCRGWGTHSLAPLLMRAATFSGVFTLLPILTGQGRAHHGAILRHAAKLAESGKITPFLNEKHYTFDTIEDAYGAVATCPDTGKVVVDVAT